MNAEPGFLLISNGYGEDLVAAHIALKLRERLPRACVAGFPTVGTGAFYKNMGVDLAGAGATLPSEGFVRSISDFTKDVKHGFLPETFRLGRRLRQAAGAFDYLVPVGDAYILLFTSLFTPHSAARKIFVNVQTSEWYGSHKPFKQHYSFIERLWTRRCSRLVYVRDRRTMDFLHRRGIAQARCCGNPMMDCFTVHERAVLPRDRSIVGVLPGSKQEAYDNLKVVFDIVRLMAKRKQIHNYAIALSPQLSVDKIACAYSLQPAITGTDTGLPAGDRRLYTRFSMKDNPSEIFISQKIFGDILNESIAFIGTSGTGNEQAAGMGKPVFGFWGRGPQITEKFMRAQKRLLGPSLILSPPDPELIANCMTELLSDKERLEEIALNGRERMAGRGSIACMVDEMIRYVKHTLNDE